MGIFQRKPLASAVSGTPAPQRPAPASRQVGPLVLEPRLLLDAAMAETFVDVAAESHDLAARVADDAAAGLIGALDSLVNDSPFSAAVDLKPVTFVFVDREAADPALIAAATQSRSLVFVIPEGEEAWSFMARTVANSAGNVAAVHVIAHGDNGSLRLGGITYNAGNLGDYAGALTSLGEAAGSADILIYGCDVAADANGEAFVRLISALTGLDVAASSDLTGNAASGGDWDLEYATGSIEAQALFAGNVEGFNGVLAAGWQTIIAAPVEGPAAGVNLGYAVAASSDMIAMAGDNGTVYTYKFDGPTALTYNITGFGASLTLDMSSMDPNWLAIGDNSNGRFYIYEFTGSGWTQRANFLIGAGAVTDVAIDTTVPGFMYAAAADTSGDDGRVRTYYSNNGGVSWQATTGVTQVTRADGGDNQFGSGIDIARGRLFVGVPGYNNNPDGRVSGYDFTGTAMDNTVDQDIAAPSGDDSNFGTSVDSYWNGTHRYLVAGAPRSYSAGWWSSDFYGYTAVYRDATNLGTVFASSVGIGGNDRFGDSVGIYAPNGANATPSVVVGAWNGHTGKGWAFAWDAWGGARTNYGPPAGTDNFGYRVAATRDLFAFSAPLYDGSAGADTGAVHVYFNNKLPTAANVNVAQAEGTIVNHSIAAGWTANNDTNQDPIGISLVPLGSSGTASVINNTTIQYDLTSDIFDYLARGESVLDSVQFTATDGFNDAATGILNVTVNGANDAPVVSYGLSDIKQEATSTFVYSIPTGSLGAFYDPDTSDYFSYALVSVTPIGGAPAWAGTVTVNNTNVALNSNTGSISITTNIANQGWTYSVTVRALDRANIDKAQNGTFVDTTFTLTVGRTNTAPTSSAIPNQNATEDAAFTLNAAAYFSDVDLGPPVRPNEALTYTVSGAATAWLGINPTTGVMTGTPTNDHVGTASITVTAADEFGRTTSRTFSVTVANTNDAPIVTGTIDEQLAYKGQVFTYTFPAGFFIDIDNPANTITYTARFADGRTINAAAPPSGPGAGQWVRFNGATRTFSGTVSVDELFTDLPIQIVATDNGVPPLQTVYDFIIKIVPTNGSTGIGIADPAANAEAGYSVAISENGLWMIVGEPRFGASDNYIGRARIYELVSGAWTLRTTLTPALGDNARFGHSVDINSDGTRFVIGAPGGNAGAGTVLTWDRVTTTYTQRATYTQAGGDNNAGDMYGFAVALDSTGAKVVVGAPGDDAGATNAGAVYIYDWNVTTLLTKRLPTADVGEASTYMNYFGFAVDFDGNSVVVGAPLDSTSTLTYNGSAYVLGVTAGAGGGFSGTFIKGLGAAAFDYYGWDVAVDVYRVTGAATVNSAMVVAVGAPGRDVLKSGTSTLKYDAGAVYTYRWTGLAASPTQPQLNVFTTIPLTTAYDGKAYERFGTSVAIDADGITDVGTNGVRMLVGSAIDGSNPGAVYAFRDWTSITGNAWVGKRFVQNNTGITTVPAENQYGFAVGIAGMRIVVGAPNTDISGNAPRGMVYSAVIAGSDEIEVTPSPKSFDVDKELATLPVGDLPGSQSSYVMREEEEDEEGAFARAAAARLTESTYSWSVADGGLDGAALLLPAGLDDPLLFALQVGGSQEPAAAAAGDGVPAADDAAAEEGAGAPTDADAGAEPLTLMLDRFGNRNMVPVENLLGRLQSLCT